MSTFLTLHLSPLCVATVYCGFWLSSDLDPELQSLVAA